MKHRYSDEQIIFMIKEQENGIPTTEVCCKYVINSASFYKYQSNYGGMDVSDAIKLKGLEEENNRLKKLLAEQMLDNAMPRDVI
jgi:putative transposase